MGYVSLEDIKAEEQHKKYNAEKLKKLEVMGAPECLKAPLRPGYKPPPKDLEYYKQWCEEMLQNCDYIENLYFEKCQENERLKKEIELGTTMLKQLEAAAKRNS